jgi:hypothetical protein
MSCAVCLSKLESLRREMPPPQPLPRKKRYFYFILLSRVNKIYQKHVLIKIPHHAILSVARSSNNEIDERNLKRKV